MNIVKIKIASALLLACCFFLPLSQCQSPVKIDEASGQPISQIEVTNTSPYEFIDSTDLESYLWFAVYFWPIPFLLYRIKSTRKKLVLTYEATQGLFCIASAYFITVMAFFGKPLFGAYLAWVALSCYFIGILTNTFAFMKRRQI